MARWSLRVVALAYLLFLLVLVAGYWSGMSVPAITVFLLLLTRAQPHARTISTARFSIASLRGSLWEVEWLLALACKLTIAVGIPGHQ